MSLFTRVSWRRPVDRAAAPAGGFADGPRAPEPPMLPPPQRLNRHALTIVAVILGTLVLAAVVFVDSPRPRATDAETHAGAAPQPIQGTYLDQPPKLRVPSVTDTAPHLDPLPAGSPFGLDAAPPRRSAAGAMPAFDASSPTSFSSPSSVVTPSSDADQAYHAALRAPPMVVIDADTPGVPRTHVLTTPPPDSAPPAYTLRAGTLIPAVLVFATSSERPGDVLAQVTHDVYDSDRHRVRLIPAGAKLLGRPQNQVSTSQTRLDIAWTRLLLPDGRSLALPSLGTMDQGGTSGIPGHVEQHTGHVFRTAALLAGISAGVQLSQPTGTVGVFGAAPTAQQVAAGAVGQQLGEVTTEMLRRSLDVLPTIEIPAGTPINVFVTADVTFTPR